MPELRHIAIEGPIGVGKTSLARRLSHSLGCALLLEGADENPFLPDYYRDPARHALATQLYFLCQRTRQLQALAQRDLFAPSIVSDFMFEKDRIFAEIALSSDEFRLYEDIFQRFAPQVPAPDVVIYLVAPVPVLQARIARRGIAHEQGMPAEYLERLQLAYGRLFHRYAEAPVLFVDTAAVDLHQQPGHYAALLDALQRGIRAREVLEVPGGPPPPGSPDEAPRVPAESWITLRDPAN